jgi:DNA/RNA-binding domain of Phe-tRNA-synthetase-like protein
MHINIGSTVQGIVKLGVITFNKLSCQERKQSLWQEIQSLAQIYRTQYKTTSDALDRLKPARDLYRVIGVEPTRTRPSSEALFRRAVKNKPFYQVNSIVDAANYVSMSIFLPIGLYDLDKIQGSIELREGLPDEFYQGIGKGEVRVAGRLVLADTKGAFGNPSSDSLRTSINTKSHNILLVIFTPHNYPDNILSQHLDFASHFILKYHSSGFHVEKFILT